MALAVAGLVTSNGGLDTLLPAIVLALNCVGLYTVLRKGPMVPRSWDRKRIILSVTVSAAFAAAMLILVVIPSLQSDDSTMRTTGFMIAAVLLASLAGGAVLARKEDRLARASSSGTN
jgi:hypothetical protein